MAITLHHEPSWSGLLARVADDWRREPLGVFDTDTVVTSAASTGRMFRQQIAGLLGDGSEGICAGVETLTLAQLRRRLASGASPVADDHDPWRSRALTLAIHESLLQLIDRAAFTIVAHHLGELHDPDRPGRWLATATQFQRLLLGYARTNPDLLRAWNHGRAVDPTGRDLDEAHRWQFELWTHLRSVIGEPDPVTASDRLCAHVAANGHGLHRLSLIDPAEPAPLDRDLIGALGRGGALTVYRLPRTALPKLSTAGEAADRFWAGVAEAPPGLAVEETLAPIELHASHGPKRQVEVLREVLCGVFADDVTLQPRDVVVFSPNIALYAPLVQALFTPGLDAKGWQHPGTLLRGQVSGHTETNLVLGLVRDLLLLPGRRATASELIDLCRTPPVAHRFGFSTDNLATITDWVRTSGVRWGVDGAHRSRFHLSDVRQNTWLSGLDSLLVGVAMGQVELASVGHVLASEAVDSADVELLGRFAEFVSRVRKTLIDSHLPATVSDWVARLTATVELFCDLPAEQSWMLHTAWAELATLRRQSSASGTLISRSEMAHALDDLLRQRPGRMAVGNGSLTFAPLGDLRGVSHRVVCVLGVSDAHQPPGTDGRADALPSGSDPLSDPRAVARQQLMDAIGAASDRAIIVFQGRSDRTNEQLPTPIVLTDLTRIAGGTQDHAHPLQPHSPESFAPIGEAGVVSFDKRAAAAAIARATADHTEPVPLHLRLRQLPELSLTSVTLADLASHFDDPAKSLFRRRQGQAPFSDADIDPTIPMQLSGLERWQVGARLLRLARQGVPGDAAVAAELMRGSLPPLELGRACLRTVTNEVTWIVDAERRLGSEARPAPVEVSIDGVQLVGSATVRGDAVVVADFSSTDKLELKAWLQLLALRACGLDVSRAVAVGRDYRDNAQAAAVVALAAPEHHEAAELLSELVACYRRGSSDVIPLTASLAATAVRTKPDRLASQLSRRWRFTSEPFKRVYDMSPEEFLGLPRLSSDPGPATDSSRYVALSHWLYDPIKAARMRASNDERV